MSLWKRLDWINLGFLSFVHLVALVGTVLYLVLHGLTLGAVALFVAWILVTGFSITAGYHRLFSHRSYRANPLLRAFYLFFGAAAFENSALKWASDHRRHHRHVDDTEDPYNIRKGFWWAHLGWVITKTPQPQGDEFAPDLLNDWLVRCQHRFYVPLAILTGFALPMALGFLLDDPWGGLLLAGFLRMVLLYHATFSVNSLAHTIGIQPYSNVNSARDSIVTALVTFGEGYHNFHHAFPFDYRNGVRRYQFDPTKWLIRGLRWVGLSRDLVRASPVTILKARVRMEEHRSGPSASGRLIRLRNRLERLMSVDPVPKDCR